MRLTFIPLYQQVVQTPANDVVQINTVEENRPIQVAVTDVWTNYVFQTNVATELLTLVHTEYDIDFVTVTRTVNEE